MKKIKRLWQNRIFKNYFLFVVLFIFLEILFRILDEIPVFDIASIRIFLGLNIIALFFSYLLSFLPKILSKILGLFLVLVVTIYGMAELGFHNYLGVYASISTSSQLGTVGGYIGDFFKSFSWTFYLMLLPFFLYLVYEIIFDKKVSLDLPKRIVTKKLVLEKLVPVFLILLISGLYYGTLKVSFMQDKLQSSTSYELFVKPTNSSLVVRNFGFIGFGLLDVKEYYFPGKVTHEIEIDPNELKNQIKVSLQTSIDNDTWLGIIENEKEEDYNTLNKYFISNHTSTTNDYTGLLKDKNLIVIMVESGNDILLNEEYYPNIGKLLQNGYHFSNNYSPRNICSTGNNEMSAMTSLYSINNNCTANVYQKNTYFESIFGLFNDAGYITNSFHDYYDWYYDRNVIHKNMGSSKFYDAIKLDLDFSYRYPAYDTWASDEELMKKYLEVLDNQDLEQPFMSFITTVSSHMPYNMSSEYGDMYMDLFPGDYPKELKRYMSKLKVVDNAIGILLDGLEKRDILDDTVIVLFGDHYPYAIDSDILNQELDYDATIDNNADQVPLIIYNPSLEAKEFTQYTSYMNILPTIANLFQLDFDSRLYMGLDAFSSEYDSLVVFPDGSWKNDVAFYNASTNQVSYHAKKMYTSEEILAINTEVRLKLEMSNLAIKKNYFHYLNEKLNRYTTSE